MEPKIIGHFWCCKVVSQLTRKSLVALLEDEYGNISTNCELVRDVGTKCRDYRETLVEQLITIMVRFVWPLHRDSKVVRLFCRQLRQLDVESLQVRSCNLFIKGLG